MSYSYAALRKLSDDELIRDHDQAATSTHVGVSYYLEELSRRRFERMHRQIRALTVVILLLTLVNTVFVGLASLRH